MENHCSVLSEFLTMKRGVVLLLGFTMLQFGCVDRVKRAEDALVHYQIAQQLISKDKSTQALGEGMKAAKMDPKNHEIQNFVGLLYAQRADLDKAEGYFRKSVKAKSDYSEAHNNLCWLLVEKGRHKDAIKHCQKAVENVLYMTPERAFHNMGIAYERAGDPAKAIEAYKKGLVHNKNFVKTLRNLSKIYLDKKDLKKAFPLLQRASKACKASPKGSWGADCPEVHYRLAMIFLKAKNRGQVISELKSCVKADDEKGSYGQKCRTNLKVYR